MASGIPVSDACTIAFKELSDRVHSNLLLKINSDMTEVLVDRKIPPFAGDLETEWDTFVKTLPEDDSRYVICDFQWRETPTVTKSKIIMLLWSPEYAPIKSKMIYASSQEAVTSKTPVQKCIQANDLDDVGYKRLLAAITK